MMESRARLHNESKRTAIKQETIPDMEDSPPVSDSDVSTWLPLLTRGHWMVGADMTLPVYALAQSLGTCIWWSFGLALNHEVFLTCAGPGGTDLGVFFLHRQEQESVRAVPESSAAPLLDVFSSMLKDTTSQHRAHLFDLNCKICTGEHVWG